MNNQDAEFGARMAAEMFWPAEERADVIRWLPLAMAGEYGAAQRIISDLHPEMQRTPRPPEAELPPCELCGKPPKFGKRYKYGVCGTTKEFRSERYRRWAVASAEEGE